MISVYLLLD